MTTVLFERWFEQEFVLVVKNHLNQLGLEERAVLLLDNAPSHTKTFHFTNRNIRFYEQKCFIFRNKFLISRLYRQMNLTNCVWFRYSNNVPSNALRNLELEVCSSSNHYMVK